jgi:hypothetical protein
MRLTAFFCSLVALIPTLGPSEAVTPENLQAATSEDSPNLFKDFDVVIAGGTTAAFAAAVSSAESGARTALIEPTNWVGGQLTASAVPAVDEAWHRITDPKTKQVYNVASIARSRPNMTPNFRAMLDATGNPGAGWVSNYCFQPKDFLDEHLLPLEEKLKDKLVVFRDTVIKSVDAYPVTGRIRSITAIHRTPKAGVGWKGYDRALSEDLIDWYSPKDSPRFTKSVLTFEGSIALGHSTVFIDATEWGEVLALANAPYLQGVETVDGGRDGNDTCGQATVFDIVERLNAEPVEEPPGPTNVKNLGFGSYKKNGDAWDRIWTYRRIKGRGSKPSIGDLSLQNWGYSGRDGEGGNDYPFGYLFKSKVDTFKERADWTGGVDLAVMNAAEQRALAWHYWFKAHVPAPYVPDQVTLDKGVLGTGTGLAKMPYIRDTRRSIGLDGFILKVADLGGEPSQLTGKRFKDRVALGAYAADIHPVINCDYPRYIYGGHETLPFCIPFRSLTNEKYGNLLVAGKTMAQSFLANSATRLHPIEWSSGTAAGVAASSMSKNNWNAQQAFDHIADLQTLIKEKTPIDWTIDEVTYPKPGEETSF